MKIRRHMPIAHDIEVPFEWLSAVYHRCPGALYVGLGLWFGRGMTDNAFMLLQQEDLARFLGVSKRTVQRHLRQLEDARLIYTDRRPGKLTVVYINANPARPMIVKIKDEAQLEAELNPNSVNQKF